MFRIVAIAGLVLLWLAACAPPTQGFRRTDTPMQAMVGFDLARFVGRWYEVAAIGREPGARWDVGAGPGRALSVTTSIDGAGEARRIAPGRFEISTFDAPLWVLWADGDMRTVVLGTPEGRFAMVLDRTRTAAPDRLSAAREILAWNGYDLGALR